MKLLIVDDMEVNLELLEARLEGSGYEVTTARNGIEALEILKTDSFDMIISDILMPKMDGYQLCRECKRDDTLRKIPFVFYTATYTDKKDEQFALSLGADRFIVKPMEHKRFMEIIEGILKNHKKGLLPSPEMPVEKEDIYFKEYSQRLINKLEKKLLDLEKEITRRKRADEALRKSERYYRSVLYALHEDILVIDPHYRITDVNNTFLVTSGIARNVRDYEDVIGRHCFEVSHGYNEPCDRHGEECLLREVFKTGESRNCLHEHQLADGSKFWADTLLSPLKDEKGKVTHVIEAVRDVTDVQKANEVLRKRTYDLGKRVKELNCLYGISRLVEKPGISLGEVLQGTVDLIPSSWQYPEITCVRIILKGQEYKTANFRETVWKQASDITVHDKRIGTVEVYYLVEKPEGDEGPFLKEERDLIFAICERLGRIITRAQTKEALRESEERFRELAELLPETIYEMDARGNLTFVNHKAFEDFQYNQQDFDQGLNGFDLIIPEGRDRAMKNMQKILRGENAGLQEVTALRKDGSTFPALFHSTAILREGKVVGLRGFVIDITERKKLESQLIQAQKMEAIGRLSGGIAHDFNNLLTTIIGYSELMFEDLSDNDPLRKFLAEIIKAGNSAASLTRQLLAFSRKQVFELEVFDLNEEITDLKKMLQRLIGEDVRLDTFLTPKLGKIKADQAQMQQVIINLAVNARDAMPRGGKLTIETADVDLDESYVREHDVKLEPGPYVMLSVSDTGIGMDKETQDNIFEPFFTTKEKGKGTGLGLATVYGIVKQSDGYIWVYSETGKGTAFKIYMPVVQEEAVSKKEKQVSSEQLKGSETVLLVEDEQYVRNLLGRVLKQYGYTVLEAQDGEEAMNLSAHYKDRIHLMVTDVVMPGMSGRELADRLKAFRPDMRVLFMSGYTDDAIVHHGILDSEVYFIQKPMSPKALARKVQEVLNA